MSNIDLIIEERAAGIGNFMVGRLLPFRQKRAVGPFVFLDHMGPEKLGASENLDVPPHPHIGLSTLTYLFKGAILHRDSIGSVQEITPGAVNWMTAGRGVTHSERTPDNLRGKEKELHGMQIWVALPKNMENIAPAFTHIPANEIPSWEENGVHFKLIAGEAFHKKSPVPVYSKMYFVEIKSTEKAKLNIGDQIFGESALYILKGAIKSDGNIYELNQILVAKESSLCAFEIQENSTIYIFGGEPFPEERYIHWNFVSSDKKIIEKAKEDWINGKFAKIPHENDRVPHPSE